MAGAPAARPGGGLLPGVPGGRDLSGRALDRDSASRGDDRPAGAYLDSPMVEGLPARGAVPVLLGGAAISVGGCLWATSRRCTCRPRSNLALGLVTSNDVAMFQVIWTFGFVSTGLSQLPPGMVGDPEGGPSWIAGLGAMLCGPMMMHAHGHLETMQMGAVPLFLIGWLRFVDLPGSPESGGRGGLPLPVAGRGVRSRISPCWRSSRRSWYACSGPVTFVEKRGRGWPGSLGEDPSGLAGRILVPWSCRAWSCCSRARSGRPVHGYAMDPHSRSRVQLSSARQSGVQLRPFQAPRHLLGHLVLPTTLFAGDRANRLADERMLVVPWESSRSP